MTEPTTIRFTPAVPCAVIIAIRTRCTNMATVGHLSPQGNGQYNLMPMCQQCAVARARLYSVHDETKEQSK